MTYDSEQTDMKAAGAMHQRTTPPYGLESQLAVKEACLERLYHTLDCVFRVYALTGSGSLLEQLKVLGKIYLDLYCLDLRSATAVNELRSITQRIHAARQGSFTDSRTAGSVSQDDDYGAQCNACPTVSANILPFARTTAE